MRQQLSCHTWTPTSPTIQPLGGFQFNVQTTGVDPTSKSNPVYPLYMAVTWYGEEDDLMVVAGNWKYDSSGNLQSIWSVVPF